MQTARAGRWCLSFSMTFSCIFHSVSTIDSKQNIAELKISSLILDTVSCHYCSWHLILSSLCWISELFAHCGVLQYPVSILSTQSSISPRSIHSGISPPTPGTCSSSVSGHPAVYQKTATILNTETTFVSQFELCVENTLVIATKL